ncbi:MAG: hypothetical protein ACFE89_11465 [Candidatus Hodarchaeota archaeon]
MGKSRTPKVTLYVSSFKISEGYYVDRESAVHACAKAGSKPFESLKGTSQLFGRVFSDKDWYAITLAQSCHTTQGIDIEIIDFSESFWQRLKLRRQGIKHTPQFVVDDQQLPPITSIADLQGYL